MSTTSEKIQMDAMRAKDNRRSDASVGYIAGSTTEIVARDPMTRAGTSCGRKGANEEEVLFQVFLDHVAWGRQDDVEKMLQDPSNRWLVLKSGDLKSPAKKTFKNITGFQYAAWALHWDMLVMLLHYLSIEEAIAQAQQFERGLWTQEHGVHANWDDLIKKMNEAHAKYRIHNPTSWDQADIYFIDHVGAEQSKLPINVLLEFCNPNRTTNTSLDLNNVCSVKFDLPEWLKEAISNNKFNFALYRGNNKEIQKNGRGFGFGLWAWLDAFKSDRSAFIGQFWTKVNQRNSLVEKLSNEQEYQTIKNKFLLLQEKNGKILAFFDREVKNLKLKAEHETEYSEIRKDCQKLGQFIQQGYDQANKLLSRKAYKEITSRQKKDSFELLEKLTLDVQKLAIRLFQTFKKNEHSIMDPDIKKIISEFPFYQAVAQKKKEEALKWLKILRDLMKNKLHENLLTIILPTSSLEEEPVLFTLVRLGIPADWFKDFTSQLDRKVDREFVDLAGNDPLHIAAQYGHAHLIPVLEGDFGNDRDKSNKLGLVPVFIAAMFGNYNMVLELLNRGCKTTLSKETLPGCPEDILSWMIFHSKDKISLEQAFNKLRKSENSYKNLLVKIGAFYCQNSGSKMSAEQERIMREATIGQLFCTAINCNPDFLNFLVQIHPEGQRILYNGQSPLHYAVIQGMINAVNVLVNNSSDLTMQNSDRKTALEIAKLEGDSVIINCISNKLKTEQEKTKLISMNRNSCIEAVVKQFEDGLRKEQEALKSTENAKCLRECIAQVLANVEYESFFFGERYNKISLFQSLLVKTLLERVNTKDSIAEGGGVFSALKYERKKLTQAIIEVARLPWFMSGQQSEKPDVKAGDERRHLSPTQDSFCERFEKQLDETYGYFRTLANGEAVSIKDVEEQQKANMAKNLASHLPNVPIPYVGMQLPTGTIVSGIADLMLYFRQRTRKQQAERMVTVFKAVTPYERTHFIRYTAEQLANKYADQIHHLFQGSEGVELFADCAAARVVEYIIADEDNQIAKHPGLFSNAIRGMKAWVLNQEIPPEETEQKALYQIFLDGIVKVSSEFPKDKERLKTINHLTLQDQWTSRGIFENTGILVLQPNGTMERYAHPNIDVMKYGYCKGTKEEADKRALTLRRDPKRGHYWGEGRIWERPLDVVAVEAFPPNHAQANLVLTGYAAQTAAAGSLINAAGVAVPPGPMGTGPFVAATSAKK